MTELKDIVAGNITRLRKKAGLTQAELAEKLNYSDKAVSKWERGESMPDITVFKELADLFGVPVDYMLTEEHTDFQNRQKEVSARTRRNRTVITFLSVFLVLLIATFAFVGFSVFSQVIVAHWLAFIYAIPVSCIVLLVFNSIWGKRSRNFLIISLLVWSILLSIYLTCLVLGSNPWLIFALGIPGQIIILLWSRLK